MLAQAHPKKQTEVIAISITLPKQKVTKDIVK